MALLNCPECGKTVSTLAAMCPHCGCPADVFMKTWSPEKALPAEPAASMGYSVSLEKAAREEPAALRGNSGFPETAVPEGVRAPQDYSAPSVLPELPMRPVQITLPDAPMTGRDDGTCLVVRTEGDHVLAHEKWGSVVTLEMDRPARLSIKPNRRRNPVWGILSIVAANVLLMAVLMAVSGSIPADVVPSVPILCAYIALAAFGIVYLTRCGRRELGAFMAEPDQSYSLRWFDGKLTCDVQ